MWPRAGAQFHPASCAGLPRVSKQRVTTIIDSAALAWENGLDYLATLTPAFRDNLGPADLVEENFAKYGQKNLFLDRETTRRLDLVQLEPGYRDLAHCCHDSVEEGFVMAGEVRPSRKCYSRSDEADRPLTHRSERVNDFATPG